MTQSGTVSHALCEDAVADGALTLPYSVLMCLYAGEKPAFLLQSLESMAAQTVPPDEMVIVFDGPLPAELEETVNSFSERVSFDVRVVRMSERVGTGDAAAQGLLECRNELVARMDSDDVATPDRMEKTLAAFEAQPELDMVGSQALEFVKTPDRPKNQVDLPQEHDDIMAFSRRRVPFRQPSMTIRKSSALAAGNYSGRYPLFEDWDLVNRMLAQGCRAKNLPDTCVYVRTSDAFYQRRGGLEYLSHVAKFKWGQWRCGYFSTADLACSLAPHVVVCLMPNTLRAVVYDSLLRKPVEKASSDAAILVYTESWGIGGIESFLLDLFELFADDQVGFTLFSVWKWSDEHDSRLKELGVDAVFLFDEQRPLALRSLTGWHEFSRLLARESYDVVHLNVMNGAGLVYAPIAKAHKVPQVVAHARNSRYGDGHRIAKAMAHALGKAIGASTADVRLAVSREAGRFLFGGRAFSVLKRGMDTGRYAFDPEARSRVRKQLGIGSSTFVVGNVGRVSQAKNPLFQVGVFAEFHRLVPDSLLLLVGDGELRGQRDDEIRRLGLEESVVVIEATSNPTPYYSAMDCLIVPSSYEGLPNTVLEAQCAGLSVLVSDAVTEEAFATSIAYSCPLDIGESGWAQVLEVIYEHCGEIDRSLFAREVKRAGFAREAMHASLREAYAL